MDRETLGTYGWLVITFLILAILISLATPFASSIKTSIEDSVAMFTGGVETEMNKIYGTSGNTGGGDHGGGSGSGDENQGSGEPGGSGGSNGSALPVGGEVNAETGEILDSWEVIINNVNNGTYASKYAVGNYKALDLGSEGVVNMQIAAFGVDPLSDGTGNANITWIAKELLATTYNMQSGSGWAGSNMRTYLSNDIWALIPTEVQNAIVAVDKTYYDYGEASTFTCSDKVWIPSWREVFIDTNIENSGVIYSVLFTDDNSRIKTLNGSPFAWWLRSSSNYNYYFRFVYPGGSGGTIPEYSCGVALCFCT